MPELPEVEAIKLQLNKYLVGHKIVGIEVCNKKTFPEDKDKLIGGKVVGVRRFGKVLVIDLDNKYSAVAHVKMTGQFIYRGPNLKNPKKLSKKVSDGLGGRHTHVVFALDKEGKLYFNDVRKFGWIKAVKTSEVNDLPFIKNLGPEPFGSAQGKPGRLTLDLFSKEVNKTCRAIKTLLMDQNKIAGVGNIYANDGLFLAKIDPRRPANKLSKDEIKKLYRAIEKVLKEGIRRGGASENSFVTPDGQEGDYQEFFLVYGKNGEECPNKCGAKIKRITLGGRGTFYCEKCQK